MHTQGRFVWFDLLSPDLSAAMDFYTHAVGWSIVPFREGYDMFAGAAGPLGGFEALPAGEPARWLAYITVPDVDAAVSRALALGAKVVSPAADIPEVGRAATLADPRGAVFAVFTSLHPGEAAPLPEAAATGGLAWTELMTDDLEGAWAFYRALFGWDHSGSVDMGPVGEYRLFGEGERAVGGMMASPDVTWAFYWNVPSLDEAQARATRRGARLLHGPMEVPGGDRVAVLADPQGAVFALHERGAAAQ